MTKVSIVIPALNEEGTVGKTVRSVPEDKLEDLGLHVEILVVDNASEDDTAKEALEAGARVVREEKPGYGSTYLRGLKEARGDIIVMGDADCTYPLDHTPEFIQPLLKGEADFVIGSRLKGNMQEGAMPWLHRYIGNPLLTFAGNLLFKTEVSDFHCGMRAFTRKALERMDLKTTGMEFATEMVLEAREKNLRIAETPIEYRKRGGGEAKMDSFRDGWRHLRFMLLHAPNYLFFLPGLVLFVLGFMLMLALLNGPIRVGEVSLEMHPLVLGSLLTLAGFQLLIYSLIVKDFGYSSGLIERNGVFSWVTERFTLEHGIALGGVVALLGLSLNAYILYIWMGAGMGSLGTATLKLAVFAATVFIIGIEVVFSSFLLSIFSIERIYKG